MITACGSDGPAQRDRPREREALPYQDQDGGQVTSGHPRSPLQLLPARAHGKACQTGQEESSATLSADGKGMVLYALRLTAGSCAVKPVAGRLAVAALYLSRLGGMSASPAVPLGGPLLKEAA